MACWRYPTFGCANVRVGTSASFQALFQLAMPSVGLMHLCFRETRHSFECILNTNYPTTYCQSKQPPLVRTWYSCIDARFGCCSSDGVQALMCVSAPRFPDLVFLKESPTLQAVIDDKGQSFLPDTHCRVLPPVVPG
jgi:hypothetical protein